MSVPAAPKRVVSLAPSATEMICALGGGELLAGVTRFSDFPEEVLGLPKVGSYVRLDLERILALRPDLCVAVRDGNSPKTVQRLERLGIPVLVLDPSSLARIREALVLLGHALGRGEEAKLAAEAMRSRLAAVDAAVSRTAERPRVLFQLQASPVIAAGQDTFLDELIVRAGGQNIVAAGTAYPRLTKEDVVRLAPEVIIAPGMTGADDRAMLKTWDAWQSIPAVQQGRTHVVDPDIFNRPSPRILDALEALVLMLHPELSGEDR